MVGCRSSRLNLNKPFSGPVSTLMSSSADFYSFSLSGRLRLPIYMIGETILVTRNVFKVSKQYNK